MTREFDVNCPVCQYPLRAALTTPAPQGEWVTVPRKATVQMAEAAERESVKHRTAGPAYFEFAYEAMLAAAPQPPQPEPHTDDVALVDALANAVEDFLKTPYDLTASILKDRRTALLARLTALRADRDAVIEDDATVERVAKALCTQEGFALDERTDQGVDIWREYQDAARAAIRALKGK